MSRKYIYLVATATFLSFLLILNFFIRNEPVQATQDVKVATPPFPTHISGTGIVEPESGSILISSALNRSVEKIYVSINDKVKKGSILFQLYNQDLMAHLKIKQKGYEESLSNLSKIAAMPREEDLIMAQAILFKNKALYHQSIIEYCVANRCAKCRSEKWINLYKFQQAKGEYLAAKARFKKVKHGAWQPDLKIGQTQVEQALAEMEAIKIEIDRTFITSPIEGNVLQIKIREGETLDPSKTAIILGNIEELNLRVSIDQLSASKFHPESPAVAFKQGDTETEFPLKFIHMEPVMVPKKYLTNELNEKVDTQIFEILYRIEKNNSNLFIGEQMDVYIYFEK
jgi:HlyD family secretion protein